MAATGGDLTYDLIKSLSETRGCREPVHIAFGIGRSTRELVQRLSLRLASDEAAPPLVVHAISPPFSVAHST